MVPDSATSTATASWFCSMGASLVTCRGLRISRHSREVSPMLASRSGLSTGDQSISDVAANIAELVQV